MFQKDCVLPVSRWREKKGEHCILRGAVIVVVSGRRES